MMETTVLNLVLIPVILFAVLAALAFGLVALKMIFSNRYRLAGIGMLGIMCFGAMFVAAVFWSISRQHARASALRHEAVVAYQDELEHIARAHTVRFDPLPHDLTASSTEPAEIDTEDSQFIETNTEDTTTHAAESDGGASTDEPAETNAAQASAYGPSIGVVAESDANTSDEGDRVVEESALAEFNPMSASPTRPDWIDNPPEQVNGCEARAVSSDPSTDLLFCTESLINKTASACRGYVRSYSPWSIRATPQLLAAAVHDEYIESRMTSQGECQIAHRLLVFDDNFRQQATVEINNARITSRLAGTGAASGVVLAALTGIFGAFSFTHRRQERRLSSQRST